MKTPKLFLISEKELAEKIQDYLNKPVPKKNSYSEEELGIGATVTLPEGFFEILENAWDKGIQKGVLSESTNKYKFAFNAVDKIKETLCIGATDSLPKGFGLDPEALEKKILEDYTV